jgi:RimJ/RimL family protein N-acetyltransferase
MKSFEIREATESDAEGLHHFMARLVAERLPVLFDRSDPPSIDEEREFVSRIHEPPGGVIFVAVSGEMIVGLLDFHREKRSQAAHGGQFGMSVASEQRRKGVGAALLEALIAWVGDNSVTRLELQVFETNRPAIRLYERTGFQIEGRRRKAVVVRGRAIDVLLMARMSDSKDDDGAG